MTKLRSFPRPLPAMSVVTMAVAMILVGSAGAAGAIEGEPGAITITQTPKASDLPCAPAGLGLTREVRNETGSFTLVVHAAAAPCSPIEAKAVVYAMPGGNQQWPQTLLQVMPFTISEPGTTQIAFVKGCDDVQFDVLTGDTPQAISPAGPWHGPLLFPFDTTTSLQHFAMSECESTSTSTSTTTPDVLGSTTVPAVSSSVPTDVAAETTVPVQVAAETTVPVVAASASSPTGSPAALAVTGSDTGLATLIGLALLVGGVAMLATARRRSATRS